MSGLSTKKRQAIIDKWLNDEEDEEWEVVPMSTQKGRFIVRHRKQPNNAPKKANIKNDSDEEEDISENNESNDNIDSELDSKNANTELDSQSSDTKVVSKNTDTEVESKNNSKTQKYIDNLKSKSKRKQKKADLSLLPEILEHLKILGDDIKRKQQRKDIKHEIKYIQSKEALKSLSIEQHEELPQYNEEPVQYFVDQMQPRYVRRKLNLLSLR
jgi:hypothetical protein